MKRKNKRERKRLIFLGLHRKPIKPLTQDLLCSRRPQVPSQWGEDAERLPDRVLEAQAKKWTQRASVLQEFSLKKGRKKEREKEKERKETRALVKWDLQLYFQKEILCSELHISQSERYRVSSTVHQFYLYQTQDILCTPFHKQRSYVMSGPVAC